MKFMIFLIGGLMMMFYAVVKHKRGRRSMNFVAYWKSLSGKGTMLYTIGLALILYGLFK